MSKCAEAIWNWGDTECILEMQVQPAFMGRQPNRMLVGDCLV